MHSIPKTLGVLSVAAPLALACGVLESVDSTESVKLRLGYPTIAAQHCAGTTTPGDTAWQQYSSTALYLDVDTSDCSHPSEPLYFMTLGGSTHHWRTIGANSIYNPTRDGFRVFVVYKGGPITPQTANTRKWHISWESISADQSWGTGGMGQPEYVLVDEGFCAGNTTPGQTDWRQYRAGSVYVDVSTSGCQLDETPYYFTSLGGRTEHFTALGATSIYFAGPSSFRAYLRKSGITPELANSKGWHINWKAVPKDLHGAHLCSGATLPDEWIQYPNTGHGLYVDVNTSACGRTATPWYRTSLGGNSNHWLTTGATSVYAPTATGFRIYLYYEDRSVTPAKAESWGWHINWSAGP